MSQIGYSCNAESWSQVTIMYSFEVEGSLAPPKVFYQIIPELQIYPDPVKLHSLPGGHEVHTPNDWSILVMVVVCVPLVVCVQKKYLTTMPMSIMPKATTKNLVWFSLF